TALVQQFPHWNNMETNHALATRRAIPAPARSEGTSGGDGVDFVHLFISPDGRIGRAAYWIGWLIILAVEIALRLAFGVPFAATPADTLTVRGSSFLIDAVLLYPSIMVMVKRLHDRGYSGWVVGWLIVPYIVIMITNLLGMSGDPEHMGVVETVLLFA